MANRDLIIPDQLEFAFRFVDEINEYDQGDIIVQYSRFYDASTDGTTAQTVACMQEVGNEDNFQVLNFVGETNLTEDLIAGESVNSLRESGDYVADGDFRQTYDYVDYEHGRDETQNLSFFVCKAQLDLRKDEDHSDIFTDYVVETGVIRWTSEDDTNPSFYSYNTTDYTLGEPEYDFGDAYAFSEDPLFDVIVNDFIPFETADYIEGATGYGFLKLQGGFMVIPNFETTVWRW